MYSQQRATIGLFKRPFLNLDIVPKSIFTFLQINKIHQNDTFVKQRKTNAKNFYNSGTDFKFLKFSAEILKVFLSAYKK
jgi:hypothetical protein